MQRVIKTLTIDKVIRSEYSVPNSVSHNLSAAWWAVRPQCVSVCRPHSVGVIARVPISIHSVRVWVLRLLYWGHAAECCLQNKWQGEHVKSTEMWSCVKWKVHVGAGWSNSWVWTAENNEQVLSRDTKRTALELETETCWWAVIRMKPSTNEHATENWALGSARRDIRHFYLIKHLK